jgi:c-di-AMP phosphodiesterase-like protein
MGGGGHFGMAAAAFPNASIANVVDRLQDTLDMYLAEARSDNSGGNH